MSQGWSKIFNRINWLNRPSTNTPLNATNLNAGDNAIDKLDDRIITLDTVKADMQVVNGMVADISVNDADGVITVTYKNGSTKTYDTNLEKIATNFTYDYSTQRLVLTLSDGSKQYVDMSALITQYEFKDSTTIALSVDSTGKISASIKNGSITESMLETGYLANITAQATKAESMANSATTSSNSAYDNAKLSQSYAIGGSGVRDGEDTDNAMYYYEQAQKTDIGQIRSEVAELNSNLVEQKMLGWTVPSECPIQNEVNGNQFVQKVGRVDLGSLDWNLRPDGSFEHMLITSLPVGTTLDESKEYAVYSNLYESSSWDVVVNNNIQDMVMTLYKFYAWSYATIAIRNKAYTDVSTFKQAMQDQYLYYELATPVTRSIDGNEIGETIIDVRKETTVNLLNPTLQTTTQNGVTCTNNGDGTYTLNGTATQNTSLHLYIREQDWEVGKTYRMVGCPSGGSRNSYFVSPFFGYSSDSLTDYGNGCTFTVTDDVKSYTTIIIFIRQEFTCNNIVLKPMLTTNLNATYDDFVPYTGDGDTLTADVAEIKNDLGGLSFSVSGTTLSITDGTNTWTLEAN